MTTLPWLERGNSKKVAIVGDVILDEYLDGEVQRISPEAPVPVHLITERQYSAGGAANTARNIQLSGGHAHLFSVCGNDEAGRVLKRILSSDGIDVSGLLISEDRPTVKKTRITSRQQQMLRVDWEKSQKISESTESSLYKHLVLQKFDAILLSDYGKGVLTPALLSRIFAFAAKHETPTIVDPKGRHFAPYQGCSLITPNRKEATEALSFDSACELSGEDLGRALQDKYDLNHVLVTLGSKGMVFVPESKKEAALAFKPRSREVFDVSGAGDTVAALMTLSLAANLDFSRAVEIASLAAGIVVEKWGTQPVTQLELTQAISNHSSARGLGRVAQSKILSRENCREILGHARACTEKLVFTNGCFDLLHSGHLSYLEKARGLGDLLIVAVNTDASVSRLKGKERPFVSLEDRMMLLAGLSCVDFVVPFAEETPLNLIVDLKPEVLVKGADYSIDQVVGAKEVCAWGGEVKCLPFVEGLSTSNLIEKIRKDSSGR